MILVPFRTIPTLGSYKAHWLVSYPVYFSPTTFWQPASPLPYIAALPSSSCPCRFPHILSCDITIPGNRRNNVPTSALGHGISGAGPDAPGSPVTGALIRHVPSFMDRLVRGGPLAVIVVSLQRTELRSRVLLSLEYGLITSPVYLDSHTTCPLLWIPTSVTPGTPILPVAHLSTFIRCPQTNLISWNGFATHK